MHILCRIKIFLKEKLFVVTTRYYTCNKRCKNLWKNVELHSVIISIDTKMFFFLLERARKVLQKEKHI